jgi:outer membrane protein assembly factor BamB
VLAGICSVALVVLLTFHIRSRVDDPLQSPQLAALRQKLLAEPKNEALKQEIRVLDLALRQRHARLVSVYAFGGWLLLAGGGLLVWSAKARARLLTTPPTPERSADAAERAAEAARLARWVAGTVGLALAGVLLYVSLPAQSPLPANPADTQKLLARLRGEGTETVDLPSPAEFAANWPRFLGPAGNAFVSNATFALRFDLTNSAGLRWQTPLTAPGFNSPLIWSNRVFLSGGDATNRSVLAFDLATGKPAWDRPVTNVPGSPAQPPEIPESTGFAASTMATDGRRVYALFANGDLAAFALDGTPAWSKNLGVPHNQYGHAISLATWQGRVIVQYDQAEPEENLSKLIALEGATGRVVWQKPRPVGASWASPVAFNAAGKGQITTLAGELVITYNAADGNELWRAKLLSGEITPSPMFLNGLVIAASPSDRLFALRPDGAGDVTKSHLAWESDENVPDVTSPASNGELVFTVLSHGVVTCYDFKDGKKLWEHELGFDVNASPTIAGDRVYLFGTKGPVVVVEAGRAAKELARFDLGEGVFASPAMAQGVMVVRTAKRLFCVGPETPARPEAKQP